MSINSVTKNGAPIGIIGAMQVEVEAICDAMENKTEEEISGIRYVSGELYGQRVVAAKCGIGKVFAAICAQTMIMKYSPRVIINTGVAGTLTKRLSIGDIAIADRVVQHDMDTSPIGDPVGLLSGINKIYLPADKETGEVIASCISELGLNFCRGTVASGDVFISKTEQKERIHSLFDDAEGECVACEMEGAAIGHVCYVNGTPFCVLRAISDGGDENATLDYPTFLARAASAATKVLMGYVKISSQG